MKSAKQVLNRKRLRRAVLTLALTALPVATLPAAAGAASAAPAWAISIVPTSPTNFSASDDGKDLYIIQATNVGSVATDPGKLITITDLLPPGLTLSPNPGENPHFLAEGEGFVEYPCLPGPPARCTFSTTVHPGQTLSMYVPVKVAAEPLPPTVTNQAIVSGGGAPAASDTVQTTISSEPATFGVQDFRSSFLDAGGAEEARAGSHPYQFRIAAQFNTFRAAFSTRRTLPIENPRDISVDLPAGLVINPEATSVRCTEVELEVEDCPDASAIGFVKTTISPLDLASPTPGEALYNMVPPAGRPAEFGFNVAGLGIFIHLLGRVRSDGDYGLSSDTFDIPQLVLGSMSGVSVSLWGNPSDPSHDFKRGFCSYNVGNTCPVPFNSTPLITMPSACSGPLSTTLRSNSWQHGDNFVSASRQTEDEAGNPVGVNGCDKLAYDPTNQTRLTTDQAETGGGFDFDVDFANDGWDNGGLAESTTQKAVVTLPEGVTINPSVGEGLGFCTPAQYDKETVESIDGEGCPADSKLGTLHVDTPLLAKGIDGSVYLAQQDDPTTPTPGAENPFDTDIALYLVLRSSNQGILVKKPLKVVTDPRTGQLVATLEDIPQLPFSHFNFHFKEGARPALVTPAACGRYDVAAKFYPWSSPDNPRRAISSFEITKGVHGGPCPPGGLPPFKPNFEAGSLNNNAKSYSPFNMRLLRGDGEQDMTKFSSILPPGVLGKLAGVSKCPDSAIAIARSKTGRQELNSPSCPANSLIGHTLAGAGVGDALTYVGGDLYLGGAYHGDPLSVISVTPALAGPFDAGTVVVRVALTLNPETAEVEADGKNSDPIPHILKGIVLKVRELRVKVDRPNFIVNPTSCEPTSAKATLFGSYLNVFDPSDDVPVGLQTRYQAADCASLGFKPKLSLNLHGGTRRGDHPALKAVVNANPGDANIGKAVVTLPTSAFLDQAHIRTICTRVQFAAKNCPKAAQYGYAKAITPLLDESVEGPVYLRSSNHKLPDLVAALHGLVDVNIVGRIDSFKGGIRANFETVPDAPVTKFTLNMQGGKKGLVVNSRNLCAGKNRADALFTGQNGKLDHFHPLVKPSCGKQRRHKGHRR
ncbi:MAG TPA: hypothetical protein VLK89_02235 [Solirubrobacterales bacterium]|nr:hypothetical protein [Solirubrobacterales bacterium]